MGGGGEAMGVVQQSTYLIIYNGKLLYTDRRKSQHPTAVGVCMVGITKSCPGSLEKHR